MHRAFVAFMIIGLIAIAGECDAAKVTPANPKMALCHNDMGRIMRCRGKPDAAAKTKTVGAMPAKPVFKFVKRPVPNHSAAAIATGPAALVRSAPAIYPTATRGRSSATAKCRDGSFSYLETQSGACSHHGGVANWL